MPTVLSVFAVKPSRIGGTETFARELSTQLGQHGWKSVLCFESQPAGEVAAFLDLPNLCIEVLPGSTSPNVAGLRRLAAIVRRHQPDVLHLHFMGFVSMVPWLARLLSVKRIFFTDHSSRPADHISRRAPLWKRLLVRLINYPVSKVICVSRYGYQCMTALNLLPRTRYELVYNAVDISRVAPDENRGSAFRRRFSISEEKKTIVQISWIIPEKGIGELLEVAQLMQTADSAVEFIIVGEGPYRQSYMKRAEEMGLSNITWTGLIRDPFGEGVYDAADVVCQLSRWNELFGWMISEAMAFKKPIVASRVGGIPELVVDGETGYLVERGDTAVAADKLLLLMHDPALRKLMGQKGRLAVNTHFNLRENVAQLLKTYGIEE
jgi:glycosyltransferase involved in cell wall biosynthesis